MILKNNKKFTRMYIINFNKIKKPSNIKTKFKFKQEYHIQIEPSVLSIFK